MKNKPKTNAGASRNGFTLIELLIVIAVLGTIGGVSYELVSTLRRHGSVMLQYAEHEAEAQALGMLWRRDVALARSVAIDEGGAAMRLRRSGTAGEALEVRYSLTAQGMAQREVTGGGDADRSRPAADLAALRFTREGNAYALHWAVRRDDGLVWQTQPEQVIFAAPLRLNDEETNSRPTAETEGAR